MNVFDHYYEKVEKENLTKDQLLDILKQLSKLNSFGSNKKNSYDLYLLMSKQSAADDDLIRQLVVANIFGAFGYNNFTYQILDNGSKKLFDELWYEGFDMKHIEMFIFKHGVTPQKTLKFWKSKHTDEKQLDQIYKEYFAKGVKVDPNHKTWLEQERKDFMRQANVSDKIVGRVSFTKDDKDLAELASNPKITEKPKAFSAVCERAMNYGYNLKKDVILRNLLQNTALDWNTVARGINLVEILKHVLNHSSFVSTEKKKIVLDFCKHKDCPDNIKSRLYEITQDEAFLPQTARDIFLF